MVELDAETMAAISKNSADSVMSALIQSGVVKAPRAKKKRMNWERVLAWEYGEKFYKEHPKWYRIEVGAIPGGKNEAIYARVRRYADLVIHLPDETLIIEFKMRAVPDVVAQLQNYKLLFPQTPQFKKYANLPIRLILVCSLIDEATKTFVENAGIEVIMYKGKNYEEWFKAVIEKQASYQNSIEAVT
jgi:hypothetical protein